jgi:hypothetical protein
MLFSEIDYGAYMRSDDWKAKRARYFASDYPNSCYCCASIGAVDLHHMTYKRLGHELLSDLLPICRNCHEELHTRLKNARQHGLRWAPNQLRLLNRITGDPWDREGLPGRAVSKRVRARQKTVQSAGGCDPQRQCWGASKMTTQLYAPQASKGISDDKGPGGPEP